MFRLPTRLGYRWFPALVLSISFLSHPVSRFGFVQTAPDEQIERYLQEAQQAEQSKDYQRSAEAYRKILQIRPQWALIHQSLGVVQHLQSRYPEAIAAFEHALKLDASLWGSHLFLGMDYYRTNQFLKAIPALEQSIKLDPKLAENEARLWLGSSYLALDRFDEALEQFRRLVDLKPKDLEALYNLAQAYNRFSARLFTRIIEIDPESAEAHRLQAEWFEGQDKPVEAVDEYRQVVEARPEWEEVRQKIAGLYLKKNDLEKAAEVLEEELRIAPADEAVLRLFQSVNERLKRDSRPSSGNALAQTGVVGSSASSNAPDPGIAVPLSQGISRFRARDFTGASESFSRAIKDEPGNVPATVYLARCHFELGSYEQSIVLLLNPERFASHQLEALFWAGKSYQELAALTLQKMIDIDPRSYRVHQMSGELLEDKRKYAEAIDAYQKALKQSPELMGIRFAIGNAHWKMQNLDEALVWLKEELSRNPYHALANSTVGGIYLARGNTELAVPFLEKAVQANPGLLVAQQDLAKAYTNQGRHEEAIARLKIVAEADPEDESIRYLLSAAYKKTGDLEAAEAELRAFTQLRAEKSRKRQEYLQKRISTDQRPEPEPEKR
jgi:tetratricopeptide (TPR) repeat protein